MNPFAITDQHKAAWPFATWAEMVVSSPSRCTRYDDSPPLASPTSSRPTLSKLSANGTAPADCVGIGVADGDPWRSRVKTSSTPFDLVATMTARASGVTATCDGDCRKFGLAGLDKPSERVE